MQRTLENLADVAFFFFVAFGLLHISSSLLVAQGALGRPAWLLFQSLDLPFLLSALVFGSAKLSLLSENIFGNVKVPAIALSLVSLAVMIFALYYNFLIPDAILA